MSLGLGITIYMTSRGKSGSEEVSFDVLNGAGATFVSPFSVLNGPGSSFGITPTVLNGAGTSFNI